MIIITSHFFLFLFYKGGFTPLAMQNIRNRNYRMVKSLRYKLKHLDNVLHR